MSLPAWECGLKYEPYNCYHTTHEVTPCVGVWIEMMEIASVINATVSLPAWECGLKSPAARICMLNLLSLPAWECGLKWRVKIRNRFKIRHSLRGSVDWNGLTVNSRCNITIVTPCVGVWIEIFLGVPSECKSQGHSLRGSVDWNMPETDFNRLSWGHSLRGSVDWNDSAPQGAVR